MKIYFANVGLKKCAIKSVLECALKQLRQPSKDLEMSLSVVSPEEIQALNKQHREVDAVTDVLSFPASDLKREVVKAEDFSADNINPATGKLNLGDVVVCLERAKEQAQSYGHSLKREMCFLALHGLLHLLGYDHENEEDEQQMVELQKQILQKAGVVR